MNKSRILLVMEKSFFRDGLIRESANCGFEVILAADIIEATQLIRKKSFEAIIAQFNIKGSDAIELILNVKDLTNKLPIIIIDFKKTNMEYEALKAGATYFFNFPVNIETILELLKKNMVTLAI